MQQTLRQSCWQQRGQHVRWRFWNLVVYRGEWQCSLPVCFWSQGERWVFLSSAVGNCSKPRCQTLPGYRLETRYEVGGQLQLVSTPVLICQLWQKREKKMQVNEASSWPTYTVGTQLVMTILVRKALTRSKNNKQRGKVKCPLKAQLPSIHNSSTSTPTHYMHVTNGYIYRSHDDIAHSLIYIINHHASPHPTRGGIAQRSP